MFFLPFVRIQNPHSNIKVVNCYKEQSCFPDAQRGKHKRRVEVSINQSMIVIS
uniref:Uncharacterized protein n=1 Tax=Lepeophtheirus salmonis TaxID=72036 RepID=A0A0K2UNP2_LEPSM